MGTFEIRPFFLHSIFNHPLSDCDNFKALLTKMAPTCANLFSGNAGLFWNILCCPFVAPIALIFRSFQVYCGPCMRVLCQRCTVGCLWRYLLPCWFVYEDKSFTGAKALGNHQETGGKGQSAQAMETDTDWVRAHDLDEIKGKRPQLFQGEIEPNDLCQGAVGDCWLVAAFACASEFPHAIRNLFITKEYNPRGLYKIRIYDPVHEKWQIITIDDRIPCHKGTRKPRFMRPNGNELWAILLEKAYAKFCGSYAALDGGFVLWGWLSMTGDKVFQMSLVEPDKKSKQVRWKREDMVALKDKKDRRACGFKATKEMYTIEQLWTLMKKYDKQKALMSASIGKTEYGKTNGPSGEQMLDKEGLVAGHAYSVIQARQVKDFRLVQLRNPWGTFEWKGTWSDKSSMWKKHPEVAKVLNFVDADDGAFWMSFEDFSKVYTRVNICDRTTARDWSLDVHEDEGCCGKSARS